MHSIRIVVFAVVLALTVCHDLSAQITGWTRLDPMYPARSSFFGVTSVGDTFYVAGCEGLVIRLPDLSIPRPPYAGYSGVCFYDVITSPGGKIWAVGSNGALVRNLASGLISGGIGVTDFSLNGIAFTNVDTGLIVASHWNRRYGRLWRTTDGGSTWLRAVPPVAAGLQAVAMRRDIAVAVGDYGTILRSTDAGGTWRVVAGDSVAGFGDLSSVHFVDDNIVLAVGDARKADTVGIILRSTDGGITWSSPTYDPVVPRLGIGAIAFTNRSHGFIVGYRNVLLETTDAGLTWFRRALPPSRLVTHDLHFSDSTRGVAVGYDGLITTTTDAGATWLVRSAVAGGLRLDDVALDATGRVAAVGGAPFIVISDPAHRSLRRQEIGSVKALTSVAWTPAGGILAVGAAGELVSCAIDSEPIVTMPAGSGARFERIRMSRNGIGWIIGSSAGSNLAMRSTDAGATWSNVAVTASPTLRRIDIVSDSTVWIVGDSGLCVRSTDAGASWLVTQVPGMQRLHGVSAANTDDALVVSDRLLLRTTDGGLSWTQRLAVSASLRDIACSDPENCVAVGTLGNTISTADRFQTATDERASIRDSLTSVAVAGARAIAVSGAGELVVTTLTGISLAAESAATTSKETIRFAGHRDHIEIFVHDEARSIASVHVTDVLGRTIVARSGLHRKGEDIVLSYPEGFAAGPVFVIATLDDGRVVIGQTMVW